MVVRFGKEQTNAEFIIVGGTKISLVALLKPVMRQLEGTWA